MDKLVSPNKFDGKGQTPDKVMEASKKLAELRKRFLLRGSLTSKEVYQIFNACAIQAEWIRELYEVVHPD